MAPPKAPAKPKTVAEYNAAVDRPARNRLKEMRTLIRAAAPEAVESLKWGMPARSYKWIVMMYAAFQKHVSLVSGTPAIRTFKKERAKHGTSGATVRFPARPPRARLAHPQTHSPPREGMPKTRRQMAHEALLIGMATKSTKNAISLPRVFGADPEFRMFQPLWAFRVFAANLVLASD